MQHRSIFQHNTLLLEGIIVQLAESTVYLIIDTTIVPKTDTWTHALVVLKHYSCMQL